MSYVGVILTAANVGGWAWLWTLIFIVFGSAVGALLATGVRFGR